jgi:hypothetical protein
MVELGGGGGRPLFDGTRITARTLAQMHFNNLDTLCKRYFLGGGGIFIHVVLFIRVIRGVS